MKTFHVIIGRSEFVEKAQNSYSWDGFHVGSVLLSELSVKEGTNGECDKVAVFLNHSRELFDGSDPEPIWSQCDVAI